MRAGQHDDQQAAPRPVAGGTKNTSDVGKPWHANATIAPNATAESKQTEADHPPDRLFRCLLAPKLVGTEEGLPTYLCCDKHVPCPFRSNWSPERKAERKLER